MYAQVVEKQTLEALNDYFEYLEKTGYMRYSNVAGLLGIILADTFLNTEFSTFVSEKDYNTIAGFLYCIYGRNCLIPYPEYIEGVAQIGTIIPGWAGMQPFRQTELTLYRPTENGESRQTEYRTEFWDETWSGKD